MDNGEILQTDANGKFEAAGLSLKDHSLIPVAPGRARQYVIYDTSLRPEAELDIRLVSAGKLTGRVLDENNQPIPGAYAHRVGSGTTLTLNGWDEPCDAQGRYVLDGLPFERILWGIQAGAPGYEEEEHPRFVLRETEPTREFTFRLKKSKAAAPAQGKLLRRDLAGIILSPTNQPVTDALVRWGATMYETTNRETRTDKDGRFSLLDVPDRAGFITVMADDYAPIFPTVPEKKRTLQVTLEKGDVARGVVKNKKGKLLPNVQVIPVLSSPDPSLGNPFWLSERTAQTDAQGRFELKALPTSEVHFDILCEGFTEQRNLSLQLSGAENTIELEGAGAIRGKVVDPDGKPVRDFRIRLQMPRESKPGDQSGGFYAGYDWYGASFTSSDGSFVLTGLGSGSWVRLSAMATGYGQAVNERVQAHPLDDLPPLKDLTMRLALPHSLRVRVMEEKGQNPIKDALVTLIDEEPGLDRTFSWGYHNLSGTRLRTDKDGWAVFPKLTFEEATVLAEHPGHARVRLGWRQKEKEFLVSLSAEAVVHGTVTVGNRSLKDYWVRLTSANEDQYSAEADATGKFRIDQLPPGNYKLAITHENRQVAQQSLAVDSGETREIKVELPSAAQEQKPVGK
jgi:hypothetical protein